MTEHAPLPDEFRTMAACEALGTMLPVFERYESLVTLVMKELLRSVYEVLPHTKQRDRRRCEIKALVDYVTMAAEPSRSGPRMLLCDELIFYR